MDIKTYIQSGVLDTYVLGVISEQDKKAVECLSKIYPEINEELHIIQGSIEEFAKSGSIKPPQGLKSKILEKIESIEISPIHVSDTKHDVTSLHVTYKKTETSKGLKYWSIAASILLVGFVAWNLLLNNKVNRNENNLLVFQKENSSLKTQLNAIALQEASQADINAILTSTSTTKIKLSGTAVSPDAMVNVFWDTASNKILLKSENLPLIAKNQQYQLWAIVDGKPVDMGLLPLESNKSEIQIFSKTVENAQAFAITLEKLGGSLEPTLSAMYVVGNVKS